MKHTTTTSLCIAAIGAVLAGPGCGQADGAESTDDSTSAATASGSADDASTTPGDGGTTDAMGSTTGDPGPSTGPDDTTGSVGSSGSEAESGDGPSAEGFADCMNVAAVDSCLDGEECIGSGQDKWGACSLSACTDVSDCPSAPAGGTAPVTCGFLWTEESDNCFLDCSGGQTCPDGMLCSAFGSCAWPTGAGECPDETLPDLGDGLTIGGSLDAMGNGSLGGGGHGDNYTSTCSGAGGGIDYQYSFTAPRAGTFQFDTMASGDDVDTNLAVLDGCGGAELACSEDLSGSDYRSSVSVDLEAGQTVIVVVDSYGGTLWPYTLTVTDTTSG